MQTVIIVVHLMIVTAMIGLVLLQKSEGGGLGMGGGGGGFLTSRGTSNVLTRTTAILAALFFATSLVLSIIAGIDRRPTTIIQDQNAPNVPATQPANPGGVAPGAPGGLLDRLKQGTPAPATPAGPQVPQSQ
jgi:preprotein translocase subunit SecG